MGEGVVQGRNAQVRRVHLADGRCLRGAHFPQIYCFIPKTREYLAQFSVRSTRKKNWGYKKLQGAKMAIRGAKLSFSGGKNFLGVQKLQGAQKAYKKNQQKSDDFFWRQLLKFCTL